MRQTGPSSAPNYSNQYLFNSIVFVLLLFLLNCLILIVCLCCVLFLGTSPAGISLHSVFACFICDLLVLITTFCIMCHKDQLC